MMLLDEPMAGMGHEDIEKIAALIKRISAKYTILMSSIISAWWRTFPTSSPC